VDVKYLEMLKGARNIATIAANIQPGEDVLIVTDNLKTSLAEVLAIASQERGAEVAITVMGLRELGQEPPGRWLRPGGALMSYLLLPR